MQYHISYRLLKNPISSQNPSFATTPQMPARRRAPKGCRLSEMQYSLSVSRIIVKPESRQQNVKLFLREPLAKGIAARPQSAPSIHLDFMRQYL
jgi:hypothetical protein